MPLVLVEATKRSGKTTSVENFSPSRYFAINSLLFSDAPTSVDPEDPSTAAVVKIRASLGDKEKIHEYTLALSLNAFVTALNAAESAGGGAVDFEDAELTGTSTYDNTPTSNTSNTMIANTAFVQQAIAFNTMPVPILQVSGTITDGDVAGSYILNHGGPALLSAASQGYALLYANISSALWPNTADGSARAMRLRVQLSTNDVGPGTPITLSLAPITVSAGSGAGELVYQLGTVVEETEVAFASPAANKLDRAVTNFAIPANGTYAIVATPGATLPTDCHIHIVAWLEVEA